MDKVQVQILFTKNHNGIDYNDALYMSLEEYGQKTEQEIETMKTERFENWKTAVEQASQQDTPIEETIIND